MDSNCEILEPQVLYFKAVPIRVESAQRLDPRREVYRLNLETRQDLQGLPSVVVVKTMKEDCHDEYQQEIENYERLRSLQGSVIPTFFGQCTFNDGPAIIISEVVGTTLRDIAYGHLQISSDELRYKLEIAMESIHCLGAEYLDQRLENFILCETGEIMIVDMEQVDFPLDLEVFKESVNYGGVGSLLYLFNDKKERVHQLCVWTNLPSRWPARPMFEEGEDGLRSG
ncbi:unnamed protein product [Penicillium salamii]|uniref:Protein kinase domain-containing protein n=1 Tax=Penicillium salamii TaxID=1612424 RepID=A0A9W4J5V9_9EURO|nr:unnamed protein product [Penicillium salamii]CAG8011133.1 unnamed protein product [Penicillium salamii]CAG8021046.1 unnamed protein product [Penicillium salamii]CAG8120689.1 unnamed protein product [Penicillium salamii]CAG8146395.1 unnamed protein product [Penicillium salamii]